MALRLNPTREAYREFYGRNTEQMPQLIADGRTPMSVAGLMQRRLDVRGSDKDVKASWMDNYFDLGDAIVYHPDGRVKVVLDSQTLREMTPESLRNGGALVLTEGVYESLQGEEFKKGKFGNTGNPMSKSDVKAHPVWKVLARDQALLNCYTDVIFSEYQARFAKDAKAKDLQLMGIYPGACGGKTPEMRAWSVYGLGRSFGALGWYGVGGGYGRLVGIAPEALSVPGKSIERIAVPAKKVLSVGQVLEETCQTSAYAPDQIKKLQNILDEQGYVITLR